ncbi:MAG: uroporphyrinogen-III C-methyltransferase [Anaerolineae bacterium]|nr:uroporphyrinogen-III C-methyltransferase [Gloeobacterales cyanobacterium ES-bin-313]
MSQVFLVGAGPGGRDYLTLRAVDVLAKAEVVLYDDLVDPQLLALAPQNALRLDVGKRAGQPSLDQTEISALLLFHARAGSRVVRLKSGDSFIFGRAVEELEALSLAGFDFEVVPGISTALAAPLLAGIPLTDKAWSQHFCVLSAHQAESLPWRALAQIDTLVILMGTRNLSTIAKHLMDCGRPPAMPVAVIYWAGRPEQRTIVGTLETIAQQVVQETGPAVIVIGPVVRHREKFLWFDRRPLFGRRILVTRAVEQATEFSLALRSLGAEVLEMPALEVTAPTSWEALDRAIAEIRAYSWLILTSANGVVAFFERLKFHGLDLRALADVRVAVVGPKTAKVAAEFGLRPDFMPKSYVADALLAEFPECEKLLGARILFVRVESGGREVITQQLIAWGALVDEVAGYRSECPKNTDPDCLAALRAGQIDCVTFASTKTVHNFVQLLTGEQITSLLKGVSIASIGPQTSKACFEHFGRVDIEATEYTLEGLQSAIVKQFSRHQPD